MEPAKACHFRLLYILYGMELMDNGGTWNEQTTKTDETDRASRKYEM